LGGSGSVGLTGYRASRTDGADQEFTITIEAI
jgi:hypothetical protein